MEKIEPTTNPAVKTSSSILDPEQSKRIKRLILDYPEWFAKNGLKPSIKDFINEAVREKLDIVARELLEPTAGNQETSNP